MGSSFISSTTVVEGGGQLSVIVIQLVEDLLVPRIHPGIRGDDHVLKVLEDALVGPIQWARHHESTAGLGPLLLAQLTDALRPIDNGELVVHGRLFGGHPDGNASGTQLPDLRVATAQHLVVGDDAHVDAPVPGSHHGGIYLPVRDDKLGDIYAHLSVVDIGDQVVESAVLAEFPRTLEICVHFKGFCGLVIEDNHIDEIRLKIEGKGEESLELGQQVHQAWQGSII